MSTKPTIVLVPGAWHTPYHFSSFISFLQTKGYTAICNQNRTCGASDSSLTHYDDAVAIRKSIDSVGGDVIVAMHSYGGIPGAEAAAGAKNVIGLIFFAAFVLPEGVALKDAPKQDNSGANGVIPNFETGYAFQSRPKEGFYHDVDEQIAQDAIQHLQTQNLASFGNPVRTTAINDVPKIYAVSSNDQILLPTQQELMVEDAGNWVEVKRFNAGHSPWLSVPDEFNPWFVNAVQTLSKRQ